jgi:hypothetical protein
MRTRWDALNDDEDSIKRDLEEFREMGIQHLVSEASQRDLDGWQRCVEKFARIFELG